MLRDYVAIDFADLAPAILQATITMLLVALCLYLYHRYRKPYLGWWAMAWLIFTLRIGAIITFLSTGQATWLYWHQVLTGLTALAFLWAALVMSGCTWEDNRVAALDEVMDGAADGAADSALAGGDASPSNRPTEVTDWILATDRSAVALIVDASSRGHLMQVEWSEEHFKGKGGNDREPRLRQHHHRK